MPDCLLWHLQARAEVGDHVTAAGTVLASADVPPEQRVEGAHQVDADAAHVDGAHVGEPAQGALEGVDQLEEVLVVPHCPQLRDLQAREGGLVPSAPLHREAGIENQAHSVTNSCNTDLRYKGDVTRWYTDF